MRRSTTRILVISLASIALLLAACGDDGGDDGNNTPDAAQQAPDAATPDAAAGPDAMVVCAERLDPIDDGSDATSAGGLPVIVISEVKPDEYIEIYNTTDQALNLDTLGGWRWCARPQYPGISQDLVIPALSYLRLTDPTSINTEATGEMAIYIDNGFATPASVADFVCWGDGTPTSRKTTAEAAGKWTGDCAPAIPAGGAIHRKIGTDGNSADDYDVTLTPSGQTCTPDAP